MKTSQNKIYATSWHQEIDNQIQVEVKVTKIKHNRTTVNRQSSEPSIMPTPVRLLSESFSQLIDSRNGSICL